MEYRNNGRMGKYIKRTKRESFPFLTHYPNDDLSIQKALKKPRSGSLLRQIPLERKHYYRGVQLGKASQYSPK